MMDMMRGWRRLAVPMVLAGAVLACGDAETTDTRGYTKAPLENPGVIIEAERTTPMSELGSPIKPEIVDVKLENSGS